MEKILNYFKDLDKFDSINILNLTIEIIQFVIILIIAINICYQIYLLLNKNYKKAVYQLSLDFLMAISYFILNILNKVILFNLNVKKDLIIIFILFIIYLIYKLIRRIKYGSVIKKYDKKYSQVVKEVLERCDNCGLYFKPKKLKKQSDGKKLCKNCIKEKEKEKKSNNI